MKTILFTILVLALAVPAVKAQTDSKKSGLAVNVGASANYYYGPSNENFNSFDNERLNYQLDGMLGITLVRDRNDHRTMLAGFGSYGLNSRSTLNHIFDDQGYVSAALNQSNSNNVYKLEGGFLIAEVLRLSTGVGQQIFDKQTLVASNGDIKLQTTSLQYYSSTVGLNLNLTSVALTLNCSFNYGKDYTKTVIVPSAGLLFRF